MAQSSTPSTVAAVLALVCVPASAAAQPTGEVSGSISDQTGAPLPGVRVTIRGAVDRAADTGAAGDFAFPDLPEGDYEISAELSRIRAGASCACACRPANGSPCPSPCTSPSRKTRSSRPRRWARRDVQAIPDGDQCRLERRARAPGNADAGSGGCARAIRHVFSEHRFRSAHDPRDWRERRQCRVGSEFGDVSRRRLPRSAGDGVRAVSRSRSHRSAARSAGHLVWAQRRRRGDQPDLQAAHERLPGVRRCSPPGTSESFAPTRGSAGRSNATG